MLQGQGVRESLREEFSTWIASAPIRSAGPEKIDKKLLEGFRSDEVGRLELRFDELWSRLWSGWGSMQGQDWFPRFRSVRNKITAHTEMKRKGGEYEASTPDEFGLTWEDVETALDEIEPLISDLVLAATNSSYGMDSTRSQLNLMAADFWSPDPS